MSAKQYIGITDFMHQNEVQAMLRVMSDRGEERLLGVGVMMSRKTLNGIPSKWSDAFPANEHIASIFGDNDRVINVLHYADYDGTSSGDDFHRAALLGGPYLDAIQFDMIWPDLTELNYLKLCAPYLEIVLQVGANAMKQEGDTPERVVRRLERYREQNLLNYVLLDKSMGQGKEMDAMLLIEFVRAIKDALPDVGIVVAGGLGPETMHLAEPIIREFPDVSIDAQGRLRPSRNALDPIEWNLAAEYLRQASTLFKKHQK